MSIDHGKVLALADRVQRESQIPSQTSQPARLRVIADELRALAQPAEAVEGVIEIMRGVVADMALSVPRQSKTVNQELVFAWHERLSNAYQELRRLTTTAGGDNVHDAAPAEAVEHIIWPAEAYITGATPENATDAAQGAVAWYVFADTEKWVTLDRSEADDNRAEGCQVRPLIFGDTRPQAAPAQGDGCWPATKEEMEAYWEAYSAHRVHGEGEAIRAGLAAYQALRAAAPSQDGGS